MTDDELKLLFATLRQEARSDFNEIADRLAADHRHQLEVAIEHFDQRLDRLAESIATIDEKLGRRIAASDEKMERGFADTQAMIKFSHDELDRRVRALEQNRDALEEGYRTLEEIVSDLQGRVERLESSTH